MQPGELVVITSLNSTLAGAKAKLSEEAMAAINTGEAKEGLNIAAPSQEQDSSQTEQTMETVDLPAGGETSLPDQSDALAPIDKTTGGDETTRGSDSMSSSTTTSE